jgi:hypothetical protein
MIKIDKDYLIPIAIIIGAIIISLTTYLAVTSHDRKAYESCMEMIKDRTTCLNFVYK